MACVDRVLPMPRARMWWRKTIGIVPTLGHGMVPTIFWSARAEGVQRTHTKHLDPDGCLVQQRYRTLRMCGKGSGRHKAEKTKNPGVAGGGNFGKKSCSGKSVFLTKAFLWVPLASLCVKENTGINKEETLGFVPVGDARARGPGLCHLFEKNRKRCLFSVLIVYLHRPDETVFPFPSRS
jgi:hypothetical protein